MCGRYSSDLRWDDLAKLYDLQCKARRIGISRRAITSARQIR